MYELSAKNDRLILDRNTAELMVDRMKDEMEALQVQKDELTGEIDKLQKKLDDQEELKNKNNELQAEVEKLKELLKEQSK